MSQDVQEYSFLEGFAVGELIGRLKHQAANQVKEWVPLNKLGEYRGVLQKYHYTLTGISVHPSDSGQVLLIADKTAAGEDQDLILTFARDDRFMDGWHAGCIAGMLRYKQPNEFEECVRLANLQAIQKLMDENGYVMTSLRIHPDDQRWVQLVAKRQP